ncbi:hypothetical protein AQJ23_17330 [Streptomyces antibioticus]|nr:baseplate J/gp47 family protein [Streptomyces antibioticus]KUN25128.1 hypothetical protein AQJ23_17330 [Streptomyces antibioticus]
MSEARYYCCDDRRRAALAAAGPVGVSGIDYVEVRRGRTNGDPSEIDIVLVKPLPSAVAALTVDNIELTGGVRFPAPRVDRVVAVPGGGEPVSRYTVRVPGGQPIDFSTYRLAIVAGPGSGAPDFLDPRLSSVEFSFAVDCAADGDCAPDRRELPSPQEPDPPFDYRTRDWEGFRRLMLDRMSVLVPGFREDDPVDLTTTIVEALAYRADQQSYTLDWVGTEAFLDTARTRASLTRHARLLDHTPGEGASARTYVAVSFAARDPAEEGHRLRAGTPVLPRSPAPSPVVAAADYPALLAAAPVVFETLAELPLWSWRSDIALHTWGDERCTLPAGATAVTLVDTGQGTGPLAAGDFLLLAETVAPDTGRPEDADPRHRHVVRLTRVTTVKDVLLPDADLLDVEWDSADALPFDLVVSAEVAQASGPARQVVCARAHGNVVLAEHGASLPPRPHLNLPPSATAALAPRLSPPAPQAGVTWRPGVTAGVGPAARVAAHGPADAGLPSAAALTAIDPARCLPDLTLHDAFASWTVRRDLLLSARFARDFVVETSSDGTAVLRFGDGTHGLVPSVGDVLTISGRFGTGTLGNLGADALGRLVLPDAEARVGITAVTNPVAASGGAAPEADAALRVAAPQAFRRQERAVTAADYADAARRYPGVADAVAVPRWTGAWQTVIVHVDRQGGASLDTAFRSGLLAHLESFRLAGFDVAVRAAQTVPLDIALAVCAAPEELRAEVARRVRAALSPPGGGGGGPGFFHPDRFGFGTPLYLSALLSAVMAVRGVRSVEPLVFQRFGRPPRDELRHGVIRPASAEVLELRDDPSFPEHGRLRLDVRGGR